MMMETDKRIYRTIAFFLQYPDEELLQTIPELTSHCRRLSDGKARRVMLEFLDYLNSEPLLRLQEIYTAAFDMNPATTLNMSYHLSGDGEKRAGILAQLQQSYQISGYDGPARDLPDFLPAMMEFLTVCADSTRENLVWQCFAGLEGLVKRLREPAPSYAKLLDLLADDYRRWVQDVAPRSCPDFARFVTSTGNQARSRSSKDGGPCHESCQ